MGIAKQQVYFTKDTGPGLWQTLRELKDNPIAHYGLLQARRQAMRVPRRRRILLGLLAAGIAAIVVFVVMDVIAMVNGFNSIFGAYSYSRSQSLYSYLVASGLTVYGLWLAQGMFHAIRDATLVLAAPRVKAISTVDELVAISGLNTWEVLMGSLVLIMRPLIPRLLIGACFPLANGILTQLFTVFTDVKYILARHGTDPLHNLGTYLTHSAPETALVFLTNILAGVMMFLHGIIALALILLLFIFCGRGANNMQLATSASFIQTLAILAQFAFTGCLTEYHMGVFEDNWLFDFSFLELDPYMAAIILSPVILVFLIRLLRNSRTLRAIALVTPALVFLLVSFRLTGLLFDDSSYLGLVGFPMLFLAPGFLTFTLASAVVDNLAAPIVIGMHPWSGAYTEFIFNFYWLVKLVAQAIFLPVILLMAHDAVKLYRQPGTL